MYLFQHNHRPSTPNYLNLVSSFLIISVSRELCAEKCIFSITVQKIKRYEPIDIKTYSPTDSSKVEIDDSVAVYENSGIIYYIFLNKDQLQVVWMAQSYECVVSGDFSLEEAKKMINSIQ